MQHAGGMLLTAGRTAPKGVVVSIVWKNIGVVLRMK
jgi:hypothetical protein